MSYKFTKKMTLQTYFLGWAVNMSVSVKSMPGMVTVDYKYASLGSLIFTVQLEKNLA